MVWKEDVLFLFLVLRIYIYIRLLEECIVFVKYYVTGRRKLLPTLPKEHCTMHLEVK